MGERERERERERKDTDASIYSSRTKKKQTRFFVILCTKTDKLFSCKIIIYSLNSVYKDRIMDKLSSISRY